MVASDALVSHRIKLGQSVHHVFATDPDVRKICSERTLRRAIVDGLLSVKAHELRRYVHFRRRREEKPNGQALMVSDVRKLLSRMYKDYLAYVEGHPGCSVCQLDSVVGKAEAERNHGLVRYVFPKGKSLDGLTQADLDEAFSNINFFVRLSKGDKPPSSWPRPSSEGVLRGPQHPEDRQKEGQIAAGELT